jgi:SAM-dependent methyltransferase
MSKYAQNKKDELVAYFDDLAERREYWQKKSGYYYEMQHRYFRFLVPEGLKVLEIGSGLGDLLAAVKPSRGVGVDISPRMVDIAKERHGNLEFHNMDAADLALDEKFDIIIITDVIGHMEDVQRVFMALKACCHDRTRLIINYYNFLWGPLLNLAERLGLKMPHKATSWLAPEDIDNLLNLAGFETVKVERKTLLPKRIPILSPFFNGVLATLPGLCKLCLSHYVVARLVPETRKREYSTSIIIACRNERGNIKDGIRRIPEFGSSQEIIFVDGHSTDGTQEKIQHIMRMFPEKDIHLLVQDGKGKGDAVRKGFAAAKGDVLMILDADLTMPPEDLPKFYDALTSGKGEFINGCRLVYPMEKQAMRFLNVLGNKFFSMAFSWLLNQRIKDTLCGTKVLFKRDYNRIIAGRKYFGDFDPFGDFDLLFGASKLNLKLVELPIRYRERAYGETNISRFRHGWLLLKMTIYAFFKLKAV